MNLFRVDPSDASSPYKDLNSAIQGDIAAYEGVVDRLGLPRDLHIATIFVQFLSSAVDPGEEYCSMWGEWFLDGFEHDVNDFYS